jgi:hypothetical protein
VIPHVQASVYHAYAYPREDSGYGIAFYGTNAAVRLLREGFKKYLEADQTHPVRRGGPPTADKRHYREG